MDRAGCSCRRRPPGGARASGGGRRRGRGRRGEAPPHPLQAIGGAARSSAGPAPPRPEPPPPPGAGRAGPGHGGRAAAGRLPRALPAGPARHLRRVPPPLPRAAQPAAGHRHPQVLVSARARARGARGGASRVTSRGAGPRGGDVTARGPHGELYPSAALTLVERARDVTSARPRRSRHEGSGGKTACPNGSREDHRDP